MGVVERLNSTILPAAVEAGGFGKDVKKFVSFEANDTKGTDQFCSAPVFGQVTLERSTSERFVQPVLVKTQIQSRTGFPTKEVSDGWFYNEILFYTKVVPLLRKYDKCNVLSSSFCEFVYGATTDNPNSEENVIVLKDLREKGFKPCTNPDQLDGDHIELVLDRLGKYHALSFMCKTDNPSGFHEVASQIKQISHAEAISSFAGIITKEAFRECVFRGIEPLRKEPRYQDKLVDLCANCENAYDWIDKYGFDSRNRLTVITHGDFKLDNMMFKYREDGKPIEVVFFDLAWIKLSSPAIDTSYFLFYNVPTVARRGRLHHLHRVYHDGLSNHLGDHREKPSIEDVELDLRKKGIFAYYFLATALPTVSSMIAGDAVPSPPKLEDLDPSQYQETMGTYMQNLRERGGVGTTEILADILRFMIDEDFIFER
ncbi:uncharacterized protein [Bemisia tabaci]|uniref:uncharacterized protein n=1 Tax=Bemisia tabaci TaxID=7038 RepID=UPI003B2864CA